MIEGQAIGIDLSRERCARPVGGDGVTVGLPDDTETAVYAQGPDQGGVVGQDGDGCELELFGREQL